MAGTALTLTDAAATRIKAIMADSTDGVIGLRIGVSKKGCSGMSYQIDYATEQKPMDEVVEAKGVKLFIDAPALMFLLGSEMDYYEDKLESGFSFRNPNEKGRCGCGESFHV